MERTATSNKDLVIESVKKHIEFLTIRNKPKEAAELARFTKFLAVAEGFDDDLAWSGLGGYKWDSIVPILSGERQLAGKAPIDPVAYFFSKLGFRL